jgi:pimeloyl-ACP methyl ester carboxylesterase
LAVSNHNAFRLDVSDDEIADLHRRLDFVRWPEREIVADWSQGVPLEFMRDLTQYWRTAYDWRRCEAALNAAGQSKINIDGLSIHFLHVRSRCANAMPLILTHGWPGGVTEFLKVIGPLTDPERHGGSARDAFDVIIPSLPGFGFSGIPSQIGWGVERVAKAWDALMRALGYEEYVAQGGDWGAYVTTAITRLPNSLCQGIHLNMPVALPTKHELETASDSERDAIADLERYRRTEFGYALLQSTRPQTLGFAIADSPVGQAAWIAEKFHAWSDCSGDLWSVVSRDELLDVVMIYWLGNRGASSARLYWESFERLSQPRGTLAWTGCSLFAKELFRPARRWVEREFPNLSYWNEVACGGHFAALEQPELFVTELRRCFSLLR